MRLELLARNELTDAQDAALDALMEAVYPPETNADNPIHQIQWVGSMWRVLVWNDDDILVSHIGILTREGTVDDEAVLIGGIGGVQTHPDARRRGYAGAGMKRAVAFLTEDRAVDFSLLVCRDELLPYYGGLGWQHFRGEFLVEQFSETVPFTFNEPMVIAGRRAAPGGGVIDLCGSPW